MTDETAIPTEAPASVPEDVADPAKPSHQGSSKGKRPQKDRRWKVRPKREAASAKADRPFPRVSLEEALRVPVAMKEKNAGNPWSPEDIAKVLKVGAKGGQFFYLTAGARDYGLTVGTRDTDRIALTDLGRSAVYPANPTEAIESRHKAFLSVDIFRRVLEHYRGSNLPEMEYLSNTLAKDFGLDPAVHEEFVRLFKRNSDFLGIKAWTPENGKGDSRQESRTGLATPAPDVVTLGQSKKQTGLLCFVIMPFNERMDDHAVGFFAEVLSSLVVPAATEAGFTVRSARRQGTEVIQQTIVTDLLEADLVVADLTEHNPNVMFELGMRMAQDKPIALIRASGTGGIFDVDNMLRVYDYDPNLWPSTIQRDLPSLRDHIAATWENRESDMTYMKLLSRPLATQ